MTDILPPAPNAAAIIKYGGIGVSHNTGAPNISIPLYTINGKHISAPVSLNYSSTGIKVDEIASRAGMGWVLKSGGVITRTVRGWADETHTREIPWGSFGTNWETFKFMKDASDAWFYSGADVEPDLFSFSFPGGSGNFVIDHLGNAVQQTYSNQKISYNFSGTDWNFKIIDASGVEYQFGGTGRVEKTKRTSTCAKNFDGFTPTAWYLKKIIHPSGEEINFNYSALTYTYETGVSQSYTYTYDSPLGPGDCTNTTAIMAPSCVNKLTTEGVLLDEIVCSNTSQKLSFGYTSRTDCTCKSSA
ncbi:MAG: hypothetical protein IPG86_18570 [Chitinophagaceae bacterium]|nr:hypothetical protein [Chitinophagaceae bacterium]